MKTLLQRTLQKITTLLKRPAGKAIAVGSGCSLVILITSCMSVNGPVMNLLSIPGATYVGSEDCATCHEEVTDGFHGASHARLNLRDADGLDISCEACHGPGSLHSENGGEIAGQIVNLGKNPDACFQCHLYKKGAFHLPSAHPVLEGRISCTDCHDPHEGPAVIGVSTALMSENETCFQCHSTQAGPFIFEHEAMRDGCTTCHDPHGSVNDKMLVTRNNNLCLQCHIEVANPTTGNVDDFHLGSGRIAAGACWSAGCHEAVHGSQSSSSLRF